MQPTLIRTKVDDIKVIDNHSIANLLRLEMRCQVHGTITLKPEDSMYSFYKRRAQNINNPLPCPIGSCDEDMILIRK